MKNIYPLASVLYRKYDKLKKLDHYFLPENSNRNKETNKNENGNP